MIEKDLSDLSSNTSRRNVLKTIGLGIGFGAFIPPISASQEIKRKTKGTISPLKDPIYFSSAMAIAKAIRIKLISSEEITKVFLDRINQVNPKINAVVQMSADKALIAARAADHYLANGNEPGPLHGVPMTIKDSFNTKDLISSAGTLGRAEYIPEKDATVVKRLKKAGAILIGKTNTPELTLAGHTENLVYGRTNNPFNLELSPGGSSGGPAAIISAGGSAFDIGTDTAGSIRIPAHFRGVCGLKPTSGRVPRTGHIISYQAYDQALTTAGPITRYVEDLTLLLPVISGSDGIDPYIFDLPLGDPNSLDITGLRYAFYKDIGTIPPTVEVSRVIENVAITLENIGADVTESRPVGIEHSMQIWLGLIMLDKGYSTNNLLTMAGTTKTSSYLNWLQSVTDFENPSITPKQFAETFKNWAEFKSVMTKFIFEYDIIICPVSSSTASPHDSNYGKDLLSYNTPYNLTGWPVAVVPAGFSSEGLPIGIQIVGKPWQEHKVLAVAKFVEEKFGGFRPPDA